MPENDDRRASYLERSRRHAANRDEERRKSALVAQLRLATFVSGVAALIWGSGFGGGSTAFLACGVLLIAFVSLVIVHARIEDRGDRFDALRIVNDRLVAKLDRDWAALPDAPAPRGADPDGHPYAVDLDLFGRASLFQWLGPAATPSGRLALARWIMEPAPPDEVVLRQGAVAELAPLENWREHLAAYGIAGAGVGGESLEPFLHWAESTEAALPAYPVIRATVYGLLLSIWALLALHVSGMTSTGFWIIPMLIGMVLSFATAGRVSTVFDKAGAGERTLERYASVFAHVTSQPFASARLQGISGRLSASGRPAPEVMRALSRILGFAELRRGAAILHFVLQALTLWDFHCLFAIERWRRASGGRVRDWFAAAGEADALACIAAVHHDNSGWCFPVLTDEPAYVAVGLGHPLIESSRRVSNDVTLGPPGTVLLITGSNMSGKSTLLRAIGLNAVLAQCGAPVCAVSLRLPPSDVQTSIRIQDSLERGVSYFMAALARLKSVVDAAEREPGDRVLLYLLDEILQGTNSAERGIAVQAVARHLLDAGAIGAMTTHDLNIASEEPLASTARLVHFSETIDASGAMRFDYKLQPGLATSRNAIRLMQLIGIDV